jgi:hypothetical protein
MMENESSRQMFTQKHQDSLTQELAEKAGIDVEAASRVLEILHIHKLDENLTALHGVLSDEKAVNALGLSRDTAARTREELSTSAVTLENLRVAVKPVGLSGIMV